MTENTDLWQIERELTEQGMGIICGCDEAGAGPLAGPVYAAAVILPLCCRIEGLNDSKKLTEKKREAWQDFKSIRERLRAMEMEEEEQDDGKSANAEPGEDT